MYHLILSNETLIANFDLQCLIFFQPRERNPGIPVDLTPKSVSVTVNPEENIQNLQPNKLSEEILKCLNFIYIRLLRTTRAMELEKSGPISRSAYSSTSSRSFRSETPINSKSSLMLQKESRQQDPYGVFNVEESIPRDIGPYKNLVIFTSSSMDPKCISTTNSVPLLRRLRYGIKSHKRVPRYMNLTSDIFVSYKEKTTYICKYILNSSHRKFTFFDVLFDDDFLFHNNVNVFVNNRVLMNSLHTVDLKSLTNQQKLAFWINSYNACIMHVY